MPFLQSTSNGICVLTPNGHLRQNASDFVEPLAHMKWLDRFLFCLGWPLGLDLHYLDAVGTPAPKSVYGEVISLFGLILTNAIALTISVRQTYEGPSWGLWAAYSIVIVAVLFGIVCILRAEAMAPRKTGWIELSEPVVGAEIAVRRHAFERGSIMYARWTIGAVIALSFVFGVMAGRTELPGQGFTEKITAKLDKAERHVFKSEQPGIVVGVQLGRDLYPKGIPAQLEGEIILKGRIAKNWKVVQITGSIESEGKEPADFPVYLGKPEQKTPNTWPFSLEALEGKKEYRLKVFLHAASASPDVSEAMLEIDNERALTVIFSSKKPR